jgi:hypothetical protein
MTSPSHALEACDELQLSPLLVDRGWHWLRFGTPDRHCGQLQPTRRGTCGVSLEHISVMLFSAESRPRIALSSSWCPASNCLEAQRPSRTLTRKRCSGGESRINNQAAKDSSNARFASTQAS